MSKKNTPLSQKSKISQEQQPAETVENNTSTVEETVEEKPAKGAKAAKAVKAFFGNLDEEKKYDLSKFKIPKDHYVVRHFSTVALQNGTTMEDPTSSRFQFYDQITYENLSRQAVKGGKQVPSQFESLGMNVQVLHDPTQE